MPILLEREPLPVAEARAGHSAACDTIFQRYQLPLYVYVIELAGDRETSLDIVQETFISAVRHIDTLHADRKFGSWLFAIAHQKCVQHWCRVNDAVRCGGAAALLSSARGCRRVPGNLFAGGGFVDQEGSSFGG